MSIHFLLNKINIARIKSTLICHSNTFLLVTGGNILS